MAQSSRRHWITVLLSLVALLLAVIAMRRSHDTSSSTSTVTLTEPARSATSQNRIAGINGFDGWVRRSRRLGTPESFTMFRLYGACFQSDGSTKLSVVFGPLTNIRSPEEQYFSVRCNPGKSMSGLRSQHLNTTSSVTAFAMICND
jgi:hypothetical protein